MKIRALAGLVVVVGAALLAGCSTPSARIKQHPELFDALAPEIQENVRKGKIEVGYPRDAVVLALGKPNREYTRRTASGTVEVWSYTQEYTTTERQRINARVRGQTASGSARTYSDWFWVDVEQKHEYDRVRVEFENDTVTAVETLER